MVLIKRDYKESGLLQCAVEEWSMSPLLTDMFSMQFNLERKKIYIVHILYIVNSSPLYLYNSTTNLTYLVSF